MIYQKDYNIYYTKGTCMNKISLWTCVYVRNSLQIAFFLLFYVKIRKKIEKMNKGPANMISLTSLCKSTFYKEKGKIVTERMPGNKMRNEVNRQGVGGRVLMGEGRGDLQSINHIFISLLFPYHLSLCTLVSQDYTLTTSSTHTYSQSHSCLTKFEGILSLT